MFYLINYVYFWSQPLRLDWKKNVFLLAKLLKSNGKNQSEKWLPKSTGTNRPSNLTWNQFSKSITNWQLLENLEENQEENLFPKLTSQAFQNLISQIDFENQLSDLIWKLTVQSENEYLSIISILIFHAIFLHEYSTTP